MPRKRTESEAGGITVTSKGTKGVSPQRLPAYAQRNHDKPLQSVAVDVKSARLYGLSAQDVASSRLDIRPGGLSTQVDSLADVLLRATW